MKKSLVLIGTVAIGLESVFMGSTVIHAENNEKISERFLNEKITVLSEYNAENQTDVVLLENGELWQVYPKVEKMMDGVKAAEAEWFSNSEQRVWILKTDGTLLEETVQGETEVDENVKEIIDSNSRIYLKEDGTVYEREKEDGIKYNVTVWVDPDWSPKKEKSGETTAKGKKGRVHVAKAATHKNPFVAEKCGYKDFKAVAVK